MLEGEADHLPADWTPFDGVTVGYGSDEAMFDSWDPKVAASICVASITRLNGAAFPDQTAGSQQPQGEPPRGLSGLHKF
nr:hypothetical protein [Halobellus inordinatus]